jgi:signal transduction histidine kinase
MTTSPSTIDAQWLAALQRLVGRVAHELKGALNGVSVNLEVIRSRAEKASAPASSVEGFAVAAAGQLDLVIALSESLLGLNRPAREPVNIGVETRRVAILLGAVARADGRRLTIDDAAFETLGVTTATGSAVRFAVTECLLAAVESKTNIHCVAIADSTAPSIRIETSEGGTIAVAQDSVIAARDGGIHIKAESSAVFINFPR